MRREILAPLGVDDALYEGLAELGLEARAALVASAIERFESMDIETILGASPPAARRVIARAREQYLQGIQGRSTGQAPLGQSSSDGVIATRVREVTERAMYPGWKPE